MLRQELGDDLFRACIRAYVARHKAQLVVTEDFQRVLEDVSGRSLGWFFDQWVYGGGHPEFEVSYTWDEERGSARLSVRQAQKVEGITHRVQAAAARALGAAFGATARTLLLTALGHEHPKVRRAVAGTLAAWRGDEEVGVALAASVEEDASYFVRATAAESLGILRTANAEA